MSKTDGDKAGEARRRAFEEWFRQEVDESCESVSKTDNALVQHALWRAFTAGERHGRAQLNSILSHGRREA